MKGQRRPLMRRLLELNRELTIVESEFSRILGDGSRWLERVMMTLLILVVLSIEALGLLLMSFTTRSMTRNLAEITEAADRFGKGLLSRPLIPRSEDEIGTLAAAIEQMRRMLEASYKDLESRVSEKMRELSQLAAENARLYRPSEQAVKTRDQFISMATHELKTPLTAIQLKLELLKRPLRSPDLNGLRKEIHQISTDAVTIGSRMAKLVDELLDLTRIRSGKLELKKDNLEVVPIVLDCVTAWASEAARSGSSLSVSAPHPVILICDGLKISQVVTNLVSNAIKYGKGQPIEVRVFEVRNQDLVSLKWKITDWGFPKKNNKASLNDIIVEMFGR